MSKWTESINLEVFASKCPNQKFCLGLVGILRPLAAPATISSLPVAPPRAEGDAAGEEALVARLALKRGMRDGLPPLPPPREGDADGDDFLRSADEGSVEEKEERFDDEDVSLERVSVSDNKEDVTAS